MRGLESALAAISLVQMALSSSDNNTIIDFSMAWQKCNFYNTTNQWMICPAGMVCPFVSRTEIETLWSSGCMWCPNDKNCQGAVDELMQRFIENGTEPVHNETELLNMCIRTCEAAVTGQTCSRSNPCTPGSSFCDYSSEESGICRQCPLDINECYRENYLTTEVEKRECVKCSLDCSSTPYSALVANEDEFESNSIFSITANTTNFYASGELIDCSSLILHGVEACPGAEGRVCLVHDYTQNTLYWQLTDKLERNGCSAVILYGDYETFASHEACQAQHSYDHIGIPFVCVSYNDGMLLLDQYASKHTAEVATDYYWLLCSPDPLLEKCSNTIPCSNDNDFCNFMRKVEDGVYVEGYCMPCSEDPLYCYFDPDGGIPRIPEFVKSCVRTCKADIRFERCKFCPDALTGSNLAEGHLAVQMGDEQCDFCPNDDVLYPQREFPMFGTQIKCWQMQAFFERIKYSADSVNCRLAQSFNHICGCTGSGYAGAGTDGQKAALVWVPRVMAILSIMGSSFIIYDILRIHTRRSKLLYQLLITLSIFDIIGSIAYAFTSLPTPIRHHVYGSHGNDATCTAQGFFIQIGTIACFINSSLSSYYYLTIIRGVSEDVLKKKRMFFFLPPIITGLVFAFVGIPWYRDLILWCNNTANYWPEIPVIISIAWATGNMGAVCVGVIKTEKRTRRYSYHAQQTQRLSTMVVKQSFLFVGAFYITWVPYLALQYMWATGRAFTSYGFVLYAASSVPLQGFLNMIVYIKPRYLRRGSLVTNASTSNSKYTFRWCCKKKAPPSIDVKKLDDSKDRISEQIESTAKTSKPPENGASVAQNNMSALEQSVLKSSMLGENVSMQRSVNDDQITEDFDDENNDDNCISESQNSALHQSVLKSSMFGESL